jgi:hypothetical protein
METDPRHPRTLTDLELENRIIVDMPDGGKILTVTPLARARTEADTILSVLAVHYDGEGRLAGLVVSTGTREIAAADVARLMEPVALPIATQEVH